MGGLIALSLSGCGMLARGDGAHDDGDDGGRDGSDGGGGDDGAAGDDGDAQASDGGGDEATGGASGQGTEVPIDETFTDEQLGDTFTVVSVLRDMPSERHASFIEEGGEVIYLQIEISPGDFGGAIGSNSFILNRGTPGEDNAELGLVSEIEEHGYEVLQTYPRREGASGPLWMAFTIHEQRQDTYTCTYVREQGEMMDSGEVVPEYVHEFQIPSS